MSTKRQSNFELLRIIAILMILTLHYLNPNIGGALNIANIPNTNFNYYIARGLESFCIVAVNLYILITGFFMYKKDNIKISKVINLILITAFYNIFAYIISLILGIVKFNIQSLINFKNTFIQGGCWFTIIYCILYLLIPYINLIINHINKKQFKTLIVILLIFFSIWPTFLSTTTINDDGYGIVQFVMLYLIGAYIAKYIINSPKNVTLHSIIYLLIYLLMTMITFGNSIKTIYLNTFAYNSIFNIIGSVSLFLAFSKLKLNLNFINSIAKHTFGIYIFHINEFIATYIWENICHITDFYLSKIFIIHLCISILSIFIICLIIDILREKLFKYIIDKITSNRKTNDWKVEIL